MPRCYNLTASVAIPAEAHNLRTLYGVKRAPCDTQMRTIIDEVAPSSLRPVFKKVFTSLQRGKVLESYQYLDAYYLLSVDGTGLFSSNTVHCAQCCTKTNRAGKITYYHQLLAAVIVHPDQREVIPLAPEPITRQDGATKNDCERNAAKRLLPAVRREHPHLKLIVVEDALAANAPHIRLLQALNMRFILGVKPGDHTALFKQVEERVAQHQASEHTVTDEDKVTHRFRWVNGVSLNQQHPELKVNFLEYWEEDDGQVRHFTWITDFTLSTDNVFAIMKGGRSRWKVENETFNTLKNQGYHFEHNFGHGHQHLATNLLPADDVGVCHRPDPGALLRLLSASPARPAHQDLPVGEDARRLHAPLYPRLGAILYDSHRRTDDL